jgi:uncharacterized membrane protein YphA (DoxX/SURF4 family)
MQNYARLGTFGILALVALRIGIGWHFYMEGVSKVTKGGFSSAGFLKAAEGPLAPKFQELLWDNDGSLRLSQDKMNGLFIQAAEDAKKHFGVDEKGAAAIDKLATRYAGLDKKKENYVGLINDVYYEHSEPIGKYWNSVERIQAMEDSGMWTGVESLRGQKESIGQARMADVQPALAALDSLWASYEYDLNALNAEARQSVGHFWFKKPGEGEMNIRVVDRIIPIFDMAVGILLIIGLLTPLASWAAALFLISVVLTQMPGYPGTTPTYYQAIEALGCIVLATTDAGRYAGLDFIPWAFWNRKKATKEAVA